MQTYRLPILQLPKYPKICLYCSQISISEILSRFGNNNHVNRVPFKGTKGGLEPALAVASVAKSDAKLFSTSAICSSTKRPIKVEEV